MVTVTHQIGNTVVRVHSPSGVIAMSREEQRQWWLDRIAECHPVVMAIREVAAGIRTKVEDQEGA